MTTKDNVKDAAAPAGEEKQQASGEGRRSGGRGPRKGLGKKAAEGGEPRVVKKRGPPRPHRRLAEEVLSGRIEKLQKRIDKARGVLDEAERHIELYNKERKYRDAEAPAAPAE